MNLDQIADRVAASLQTAKTLPYGIDSRKLDVAVEYVLNELTENVAINITFLGSEWSDGQFVIYSNRWKPEGVPRPIPVELFLDKYVLRELKIRDIDSRAFLEDRNLVNALKESLKYFTRETSGGDIKLEGDDGGYLEYAEGNLSAELKGNKIIISLDWPEDSQEKFRTITEDYANS